MGSGTKVHIFSFTNYGMIQEKAKYSLSYFWGAVKSLQILSLSLQ